MATKTIVNYDAGKMSLADLEVGQEVRFKSGSLGKVIMKKKKDKTEYKGFVFTQGLSGAQMELLRKKRRAHGQGTGRRPVESKHTPVTVDDMEKAFDKHYTEKAMKETSGSEEAKKMAEQMKEGDRSRSVKKTRVLKPGLRSHRNLYVSDPEKYDMPGIDAPEKKNEKKKEKKTKV